MGICENQHGDSEMQPLNLKYVRNLILALFAFTLFYGSFYVVNPGETGLIIRIGKLARISGEGLNFKLPWIESVVKMETRILKRTAHAKAASKDLQQTDSKIAVNYRMKKSAARSIYTNFGDLDGLGDRLLDPSIQEVVKAVTSRFTAEELITKRDTVSQQMRDGLESRLNGYGIEISSVSIINFNFSAEFDKSVEEKNVAVQKALTAQRDLERVKIEAEQKIATAKAEAEALRLQKTEITPAMVQLRAIQKWNGKLPQYVGNGQTIIDLKSITK